VISVIDSKITEASAKRHKFDKMARGMDVKIDIVSAKEKGEGLLMNYGYVVEYEDVATLSISGEIEFALSKDEKKQVLDEWKSKRNLPRFFAEQTLMPVTYSATTVGTLLAFSINIQAPLNLPQPRLEAAPSNPAA
jgi:hypothetical protein